MRNLVAVLPWIAGAALLSAPSAGGPPRAALVAPDARWVVHADVEAMTAAQCFRFLLDSGSSGLPLHGLLERVKHDTGLDPVQDLRNVTMYASAYEADRTVSIFELRSPRCEVVRHLRELAGEAACRSFDVGGFEMHAITLNGATRVVHVQRGSDADAGTIRGSRPHRGSVLVIGASESDVLSAARRLREESSHSAAAEGGLPKSLFDTIPPGTLLHAAAVDMKAMSESSRTSDTVRRLAWADLNVGEADGGFFLRLNLGAESDEDAEGLVRAAERLRAFLGQLAANVEDAAEEGGDPAPMNCATGATLVNRVVEVTVDLPAADFRRLVESAAQYLKNRGGAGRSPR